jgi:hypothetical protein
LDNVKYILQVKAAVKRLPSAMERLTVVKASCDFKLGRAAGEGRQPANQHHGKQESAQQDITGAGTQHDTALYGRTHAAQVSGAWSGRDCRDMMDPYTDDHIGGICIPSDKKNGSGDADMMLHRLRLVRNNIAVLIQTLSSSVTAAFQATSHSPKNKVTSSPSKLHTFQQMGFAL